MQSTATLSASLVIAASEPLKLQGEADSEAHGSARIPKGCQGSRGGLAPRAFRSKKWWATLDSNQ